MTYEKQMLRVAADELNRAHDIIGLVAIGTMQPVQALDLLDARLSSLRFALKQAGLEEFQAFDFDNWVRNRYGLPEVTE
jgi:hypothetical protein